MDEQDETRDALARHEAVRQGRADRLKGKAARARGEADAAYSAARQIGDMIPLGQPILVGHYSAPRHLRDIEKIRRHSRRAFLAFKRADALEAGARGILARDRISSDEGSDALLLLRDKCAKLEAQHAAMKAMFAKLRAAWRSTKDDAGRRAALLGAGFKPGTVASVMSMGGSLPTYMLTNSNAEIRRLKGRIVVLERQAAAPAPQPETIGEIELDQEDNRVRLSFPGKPSEAVRKELKRHGFKWAPSVGRWQRMTSDSAWYWARSIARALSEGAL